MFIWQILFLWSLESIYSTELSEHFVEWMINFVNQVYGDIYSHQYFRDPYQATSILNLLALQSIY